MQNTSINRNDEIELLHNGSHKAKIQPNNRREIQRLIYSGVVYQ
jgi:hypothetical protein